MDGERLAVWKISWDNPQTESTMRGQDGPGSSSEDYNWQICFSLTEDSGRITNYWLSPSSASPSSRTESIKSIRLNPVSCQCYWHNLHYINLVSLDLFSKYNSQWDARWQNIKCVSPFQFTSFCFCSQHWIEDTHIEWLPVHKSFLALSLQMSGY